MAPLPILPILMAMPAVAKIIHDLFGENKEDAHSQQMRALLEMAEGRLAEMQAQLVEAEKRCAVAEARLDEARKKRGWWPWSRR